jgi:hypothetical protein
MPLKPPEVTKDKKKQAPQAKIKNSQVDSDKHAKHKKIQEEAIKTKSHYTFKVPAPRPPKRLIDREDLHDALLQCKRRFKLKHPPVYYKSLENIITPAKGWTWEQVELDRALRSYKQYYLLPEFKAKAEEIETKSASNAKALVKLANETCHTWGEFKAFVLHHKGTSILSEAIKLYKEIGYQPSLFHTLYLL